MGEHYAEKLLLCLSALSTQFDIVRSTVLIILFLSLVMLKKLKRCLRHKIEKYKNIISNKSSSNLQRTTSFLFLWTLVLINRFAKVYYIVAAITILMVFGETCHIVSMKQQYEKKYKEMQKFLVLSSDVMKISEKYYERSRVSLIKNPPDFINSATSEKIKYSKEKAKLFKKLWIRDLEHNKGCERYLKNTRELRRIGFPRNKLIYKTELVAKGLCKNSYMASYLLGLLYQDIGNYTEAKIRFEQAIKVMKEKKLHDCTLLHSYAEALLYLEMYDKAKAYLEDTLSYCIWHLKANAHLSELQKLEELTAAKRKIKEFRRAVENLSK